MKRANYMRKEKVLIVHNYYQIPGGEDTVVANEKKMLEDNGHEVFTYTRNNNEIKKKSLLGKLLLVFESIFSIKTYREVKKSIKKNKIDIVHVHNTLSLISPSVYYAAFKCKIPVVQTIHNFRLLCPAATLYRDNHICEDCISKGLRCAIKYKCYRGSFLQTLISVLIIKINRILGTYRKLNYICLTEFNKEKLLQLNRKNKKIINEDKIFIKPNFVNKENNIIPYEERKSQFVFVGRLDPLKGVDILLNAWKKVNYDAGKLVICGTGPMNEWCNEFIKVNKLENIELLGFVENNLARKIISESKALILPTQWYEGFPMTIVEAYSEGTPVIGSDIGNTGSLIINELTGIKFKYNSIEELTNIVNSFDKFKDKFNVYDFYTKNYKYNENYNILKKIYIKCLKEKQRG